MLEQQSEYVKKIVYDPAVSAGSRCGRMAIILLIVDFVLTLTTKWIFSLVGSLDMSFSSKHDLISIVNLGEILSALIFVALIAIFIAAGALAVKRTSGLNNVAQVTCVSTASGLITGSMAIIILVAGMIVVRLNSMPETGYMTMFTQFSPDSMFGILMWLPVIVILAIASGICYAGMTRRIKKLY
jgi:hypothetical protein